MTQRTVIRTPIKSGSLCILPPTHTAFLWEKKIKMDSHPNTVVLIKKMGVHDVTNACITTKHNSGITVYNSGTVVLILMFIYYKRCSYFFVCYDKSGSYFKMSAGKRDNSCFITVIAILQ